MSKLSDWQKDIIDTRLANIKNNPDRLRPICKLFEELDSTLQFTPRLPPAHQHIKPIYRGS